MTRVGHTKTATATVRVENRGAEPASRSVALVRGNTEVDSVSVSLDVGEETVITLNDDSFGESDIGSTFGYTADTGHRTPTFDAEIIGLLVVDGQTQVPTFDVGRIDWNQNGALEIEQTDELRLTQ